MKILTCKEASLENVNINIQQTIKDRIYVEILNDKDPLYIQTPKMFCSDLKMSTIDLYFKNSRKEDQKLNQFYTLFRNIENKICELVSKKSSKLFSKELSPREIKNNYFISSIKFPESLDDVFSVSSFITDPNFEVYNQKKEKIDRSSVKKNTDTISILMASDLIVTPTNVKIVWDIVQMKNFRIKEKIIGCGIIDDNFE